MFPATAQFVVAFYDNDKWCGHQIYWTLTPRNSESASGGQHAKLSCTHLKIPAETPVKLFRRGVPGQCYLLPVEVSTAGVEDSRIQRNDSE